MTRPEKTFAVVVGVEKYAAGTELNLPGPVHDAGRFIRWLLSKGVPSSQILLFLSPLETNQAQANQFGLPAQPAEEALITAALLDTLPQRAGDLLFLFWGGHGVMDAEGNRRLLYADAMTNNLRNLNLNSLLNAWRTQALRGFLRQICLVDACANYLERRFSGVSLPGHVYPAGLPRTDVKQFALLAAAPGEFAKNSGRSGIFSSALLDRLEQSGAAWPPDMVALNQQLQEHFADLRDRGETRQMPTHIWYRDWDGSEGALATQARMKAPSTADKDNPAFTFDSRYQDQVNQLRQELEELITIISDLRDDRDVDSANKQLSEWKKRTNPILKYLIDKEYVQSKIDLYDISLTPDPDQKTLYNKTHNEARKCQKFVEDLLKNLGK
jgi:hypothetical protein